MKKLQILHIKDKEDFDRSVVLGPLIKRVKKDRDTGFEPELVVVTGDVAFKGIGAEYDSAKRFLDDLMRTLSLPNDNLFIVPGNHDVNRKKYRPSDTPEYMTMRELNEELENKDFRAGLGSNLDL
jgi:3',5'-cyclic AMP phosphodiesterase CpdA